MSDPFRPYPGGAMVFQDLAFYHIFIMILSVVIMSSTAASASQLVVSLEELPSLLREPGERAQHSALQAYKVPLQLQRDRVIFLQLNLNFFVMKMESNATFDSKTPKFMIFLN